MTATRDLSPSVKKWIVRITLLWLAAMAHQGSKPAANLLTIALWAIAFQTCLLWAVFDVAPDELADEPETRDFAHGFVARGVTLWAALWILIPAWFGWWLTVCVTTVGVLCSFLLLGACKRLVQQDKERG